ncbi:MAG: HlyD family efflux transporter periplasmic adaptor subunit [Sphingomonadaceae bacterium]|nr:HlyD family efflux transporter periplasmic adaptor subunit [Sphingomonadaceae bacterium]
MAKRSFLRPGPIAISATVALVVVAALYLAIRKPPYQVDLAQVTQGPMTVTIDDEGETRVHDLFVVAAPINGRLTRIELEPGDPVIAGETEVAQMTPVDPDFLDPRSEARTRAQVQALDAAIASSSARIEQARAARDLAQQEQGRMETLFNRGFATRAALDRANATVSQAKAAHAEAVRATEAARFDRDAARANLVTPNSRRRSGVLDVRSPTSGTVMRVSRESEATVAAGTPLVEIGNPRDLEIVTDLLSADAVRLTPGARVLIDNWGGNRPLNGRVRRIEPFGFTKISALGVEEQRVNVIIDITDPPAKWTKLGHGYRVIVRAVEWESANALQLPVSSLFRNKGNWVVFAVENGRARLIPVKVGRMNDERAELLGGLKKGAHIILHPSEKITDGARVERR